jgi:hypothetical protein
VTIEAATWHTAGIRRSGYRVSPETPTPQPARRPRRAGALRRRRDGRSWIASRVAPQASGTEASDQGDQNEQGDQDEGNEAEAPETEAPDADQSESDGHRRPGIRRRQRRTSDNHGKLVSEAAHAVTPAGFDNHGAYVRTVAQQNHGADASAKGKATSAAAKTKHQTH